MSFLACAAGVSDLSAIDGAGGGFGRDFRRFNLPVKLALAAAHVAAAGAVDRRGTVLVSLSPCRPGSPELWQATAAFERSLYDTGRASAVRVNPTYTLHAIDNLALSCLAMDLENRAPYLGLGGAAGQSWCALEHVLEHADAGAETLIFAGDQDETGRTGEGVAMLFSPRPKPFAATGRTARLVAVERRRWSDERPATPRPHAARGLRRWLGTLAASPPGRLVYDVPAEDGDGVDHLSIVAEVA